MPVSVLAGDGPIIITLPHAATDVPRSVMERLNDAGRALTDTDWHIDRLFHDLAENATIIRANFHRYMCNANGNPTLIGDEAEMGSDAVVPMFNLDGEMIWDVPPDRIEKGRWRAAFHAPYHAAIAAQIAHTRAVHGYALLLDCHALQKRMLSADCQVPPDIGICTDKGSSCDPALTAQLSSICMASPIYTTMIHAGSKGGWTVRRYGRPKLNVHALQIEISVATYLTEMREPWLYDAHKATPLRAVLRDMLLAAQRWKPSGSYLNLR